MTESTPLISSTGERFVPAPSELDPEIELEHVHRYLAAARLCVGKTVLDAACGEGYGSQILSRSARSVDGVDIDAATIEAARLRYPAGNLTFHQASALALPFEAGRFDCIVSFETLEHIREHEPLIAEFRRVLKPDGVLIISTPDKTVYNRHLAEPNAFHLRELERDEFEALLEPHFKHRTLYGQRVSYGSVLTPLEAAQSDLRVLRRNSDGLVEIDGAREASVYLIAVCSDAPTPALSLEIYEGGVPQNALSSILGGVTERDAQIRALTTRLAGATDENARKAAETMAAEAETLRENLGSAAARLENSERRAAFESARLESALNQADQQRKALEAEVAQLTESMARANDLTDHLQAGLESATREKQAMSEALSQTVADREGLSTALEARERELNRVTEQSQALSRLADEQAQELKRTTLEGQRLAEALSAATARTTALDVTLAETARQFEAERAARAELAGQVQERDAAIAVLKETERRLSAALAESQAAFAEERRRLATAARQTTVAKKQLTAAKERVAELQAEATRLALAQAESEAQARAQIGGLLGRIEDRETQSIQLGLEIAEVRAEVDRLKSDLDRAEWHREALIGELTASAEYARKLAFAAARPAPIAARPIPSALSDAVFAAKRALRFGPMKGVREWRDVRTLRDSALFDPDYYGQQTPNLSRAFDPVRHYVAAGAAEGRNPSRRFNTEAYAQRYPDVIARGVNPLSHYEAHGAREGRRASAVLDEVESGLVSYRRRKTAPPPPPPRTPVIADWMVARNPEIPPAELGLYDRRPDDVVPREGLRGERFIEAFDLLSESPRFREAIGALNRRTATALPGGSAERPKVSIVIPVYGQLAYTLNCLDSLIDHVSRHSFEILIGDDVSPDETGEIVPGVNAIRYHRRPQNGGFILNCNGTAELARGDYVVFLNSDTRVAPGWLDELVESFDIFPKAGLVGSKLFYPDGSLQEAGGIIWRDGSAWNYGRNDDPNRPEYCYARQVDYISGASIILPTALWRELGGFDEHYKPAYAEDADLAFRVRAAGLEVWYQPLSRVIHYEGKTSGTDIKSGVKAYQVANGVKLFERWKDVLAGHRPNGQEPEKERERNQTRHALIIDAVTPTPDQDAGSVTTVITLKLYGELGFKVHYVPEDNFLFDPVYTAALQRIGIECVYAPYEIGFQNYISRIGRDLSIIQSYRMGVTRNVLGDIRHFAPDTPVAFHNMDMHFLRMQRQADLNADEALAAEAEKVKARELDLIRNVDCTIVHSPVERDMLADLVPGAPVVVFPYMTELVGAKADFDERRDIIFLGGYRHGPNVDAALYFAEEIWPLVKDRTPGARYLIAGSHPPPELKRLADDRIIVTGMIEDLRSVFETSRVFAASIRFGAGIKGKVSTSMAYGVPVVATDCAAEGMYLESGKDVLIADDPQRFADEVVRLWSDAALWRAMSKRSLEFVEEYNSFEMGKRTIRDVIAAADAHHAHWTG